MNVVGFKLLLGHTFKGGKIKSNMLGNVNPFFYGKDLMGYDIYLNTNHDGNVFPQVFVQGKWMNLLTKTMSYRDFDIILLILGYLLTIVVRKILQQLESIFQLFDFVCQSL